jgi:hypothetical protein
VWFDKKSWRLRRKIKDLQADLRAAEKEGRYVLEDGLFFAELEDMGEMTMLVFGTTDVLSAQEETVTRSFFERNGFTVHRLKIDKSQSHLAEVEIIPPSEMVRYVARRLKSQGYKVLDDSAKETPSELDKRIITLSGLVRALVILFCERVQRTIASTRIKMNKEGNRLLHWMPRIAATLHRKTSSDLVSLLKPLFEDAYAEFYGHLAESTSPRSVAEPALPADRIPAIQFPAEQPPLASKSSMESVKFPAAIPLQEPKTAPAPPPTGDRVMVPGEQPAADMVRAAPPKAVSDSDRIEIERLLKEVEASESVARMYRKLVRAQSSRCVRNAQALLEEVNRLFGATASCLLVKVPHAHGVTIHAQAGKPLIWGQGGREGFPVSTSVVAEVVKTKKAAKADQGSSPASESMILHSIEAVAAAPVFFNGEIVAIVYVDRREGLCPFDLNDMRALERVAKVFEEFPDLTLGLV